LVKAGGAGGAGGAEGVGGAEGDKGDGEIFSNSQTTNDK